MKVLQREIYKLQQGAGQPHVYARDLEKIIIPTPSPSKQTEMLKHINDIHKHIKKMQSEAAEILATAKQEVEEIIFSPQ
jgi:restriction endonuclease S subunit